MSTQDLIALGLTLQLAATVTVLLLLIGTPLAWWLARSQSWLTVPMNALVAMPLVLPPTVIGFYLLIAMGPQGFIGQLTASMNIQTLAFSYWGIVIGSMIYSLPFVVQPIQNAFERIGDRPLEVAASLGAGPIDRFFTVAIPLAKPGYLSAIVLGFAHTIGEFGVILMIGGNIPGETKVASIQLYDYVESLNYTQAHHLALSLVVISLAMLIFLYAVQGRKNLLYFRSR